MGNAVISAIFKANFHVLKYGLPRVAVVVDPPPLEDELAEGLPSNRLLLQGASVVRFANTYLDEYKGKRNFVFTAISIDHIGEACRFILCQIGRYDEVRTYMVF